jgi:hypothetical protein
LQSSEIQIDVQASTFFDLLSCEGAIDNAPRLHWPRASEC